MNRFSKPSFSSTLLHRMKSLFDCIISQDIQLIDFNYNDREPYLYAHEYGDIENERLNFLLSENRFFEQTDQSDSSDVPLLEVKKVNKRKRLFSYNQLQKANEPTNHKKLNHKLINHRTIKEQKNEKKNQINGLKKDNKIKKKHEQLDDNLKQLKNHSDGGLVGLRSAVFKMNNQSTNNLFKNFSNQFDNWPIKNKEKYLNQLIKGALIYIQLDDLERAELVLFQILDLIFYNSSQKPNIPKAIETLKLLDSIYDKMNRYIELIQVNKLILNICNNFKELKRDQIKASLERIVFAYKKMNLVYKAHQFIDNFNKKIKTNLE